jgi:hypothetical protein
MHDRAPTINYQAIHVSNYLTICLSSSQGLLEPTDSPSWSMAMHGETWKLPQGSHLSGSAVAPWQRLLGSAMLQEHVSKALAASRGKQVTRDEGQQLAYLASEVAGGAIKWVKFETQGHI